MEPIPIGTVVDYRGSHTHGRYVVIAHQAVKGDLFRTFELEQMRTDGINMESAYPDGIAYEIWPEGMQVRFGNRDNAVYRVRRGSLTVINDE